MAPAYAVSRLWAPTIPRIRRLIPRTRRELLGVAAPIGLILALFAAFGPPVPGPNVREWIGLADPPDLTPCTPDAQRVKRPDGIAPQPGSWRREPDSPLRRTEMSGVSVDGVILTVAGQPPSREVLRFDPDTSKYARETQLPVAVDHALVAEHEGDVYVVGGFLIPKKGVVSGSPTNRAWRYDRDSGTWTELAEMRRARGGLGGGVVGDKLYAISGGPNPFPEERGSFQDVEVLDLKTGKWSAGPPIPTPRHHLGSAAVGPYVYVVGGREPETYKSTVAERLDTRTGKWERLPPLPLGAGDTRAVNANGSLVVIGGDDEIGWQDGGGYVTPATWRYDDQARRWIRLPDLNVPRHGFAAAVAEGRIYVFEGSPCPGHGWQSTAESLPVPAV